jgi:hypothetical protein
MRLVGDLFYKKCNLFVNRLTLLGNTLHYNGIFPWDIRSIKGSIYFALASSINIGGPV